MNLSMSAVLTMCCSIVLRSFVITVITTVISASQGFFTHVFDDAPQVLVENGRAVGVILNKGRKTIRARRSSF
jgi:hypothetical protein